MERARSSGLNQGDDIEMTMLHSVKKVLPVLLICVDLVPVCAAKPGRVKAKPRHPTAFELLDKYAETQGKLKSFVAKGEISTKVYTFSDNKPEYQHYSTFDGRVDEKRAYTRTYAWGDINPTMHLTKDKAYYASHLWDGKDYYAYNKAKIKKEFSKGTVFLVQNAEDKQRPRRTSTFEHFPGSIAMGHLRKTIERIDSIIRKADSVRVRDKMEKIGGSDCYVIEAKAKTGDYTVWIDPAHGYNIAKAELRKGPGDVSAATGYVLPENDSSFASVKNVRFKKIGDLWVPIEADVISGRHKLNSRFNNTTSSHCKITEIKLNPDHDTLGSFVPDDILNGAKVRLFEGNDRIPGRYTWQDGEVVDKDGRVIMDCRPKKASGSAESKPKSAVRKRPSAWELLRRYAEQQAKVTAPRSKERVVHFPPGRSLGRLMVQDANTDRRIEHFDYRPGGTEWEHLGEATGDVVVPAGKRLGLMIDSTAWKDLSPLANLGPDDLYMLSISGPYDGGQLPDDRCMPHIAHLTGLKVLHLVNTNISAKGMGFIKSLDSLERLSISKQLTDQALAEIADLPSLKALYLKESRLTNAGLAHLGRLTSLEELQLVGGRIGDAGLAHLAKLPSLRYLMLFGKNFSDDGMVHLKNIPSLRILDVGGLGQITDTGLLHLSYVINLENLNLHWVEGITDSGVAHLRKLRSLKKLDIRRSQVTDRGLAQLKQMKSLEYLSLPARGITDKGLAFLSELSSLKHLDVSRVYYVDPKKDKGYYTDKGIEALSRLHLLEELNIGSIGVTDAGMSHIAKLSNLKELNIFGCPITNAGLHKLTTLKSLRRLSLSYAEVTISGLAQLSALPNLTDLNVRRIRRGNSVLNVSGLTKLEDLSLGFFIKSGDYFTDKDLACLSGLKRLERLQLHPRKFSDEGVAYLADLTEMKFLGIGGPDLTDEGLLHLANMKKLFHLTISDGDFGSDGSITDNGLGHLEGLKALGYLNITSRHRFSAAAKRRLREQVPYLVTFRTQVKGDSSGAKRSQIRNSKPRTPQGARPTRPKSRR